ncbi:MAG: helix-turn-helix transcriptional regulator [Clostridia bacterium]|nr:helix-turn-helix transcriptional regulator [Clostridia bacterium]
MEKGLTQVQLAKSVGVGQSTLNYWENGKSDITSFLSCKVMHNSQSKCRRTFRN